MMEEKMKVGSMVMDTAERAKEAAAVKSRKFKSSGKRMLIIPEEEWPR